MGKETLTGFNGHAGYLHTKILLVGALGETPTAISGSANFSEAPTTSNDENTLVIARDDDAADVYFTDHDRLPDMDKIGGGRGGSSMFNGTGIMSGAQPGRDPLPFRAYPTSIVH